MTLGCVLDNTIDTDKFKSRPVPEGHVWCIVRFAFSAENKGGGWLGGSGKTFGRGNWESKGKDRTRTDLPRKARSLFGQRGKIEISVQSPLHLIFMYDCQFYARIIRDWLEDQGLECGKALKPSFLPLWGHSTS